MGDKTIEGRSECAAVSKNSQSSTYTHRQPRGSKTNVLCEQRRIQLLVPQALSVRLADAEDEQHPAHHEPDDQPDKRILHLAYRRDRRSGTCLMSSAAFCSSAADPMQADCDPGELLRLMRKRSEEECVLPRSTQRAGALICLA